MSELINWVNVTSKERKKVSGLKGLQIAVYEKVENGKVSAQYVTLSNELFQRFSEHFRIKFGTVGQKVVFRFTHEPGLNICINKKAKTPVARISSRVFVDIILRKYPPKADQNTTVYSLIEMDESTFMINEAIGSKKIDDLPVMDLDRNIVENPKLSL